MAKKDQKKRQQQKQKQTNQSQVFEQYQQNVVEDQLENNKGIHHFNNQSR